MKKNLIISFDLIRETDINDSFATSFLTAYIKADSDYGKDFIIEKKTINLYNNRIQINEDSFNNILPSDEIQGYHSIAISAYLWNEYLLNPFISYIRKSKFNGNIILGGYQITFQNKAELIAQYPDCNIFIIGYAEESLLRAIKFDRLSSPIVLEDKSSFNEIPSPYLTEEIKITDGQRMVRMMSKRGCLYNCRYCAHRDLVDRRIQESELWKACQELELFCSKRVKRINIIDPVFNYGNTYLALLERIKGMNFGDTSFTLQTRLELIKNKEGEKFLDLVSGINAHLELGIQTLIKGELESIGRITNVKRVEETFRKLNERDISYETSIIYGLPNQTFNSFRETIKLLKEFGCNKIYAYPLMLLRGTELYNEKEKWGLEEEILSGYDIPTVTSSYSFSKREWEKMDSFAKELN